MARLIAKLSLILGVISVIVIFFTAIFSIIALNQTILILSLVLAIIAVVLGIISIIFVEGGTGLGVGGIVTAIITIFIYFIMGIFF